ncbi:MAG: hypothetical protein AB4057_20595, partial [Crocosphaera sp.]
VASYQDVDSNFSEKGNSEKAYSVLFQGVRVVIERFVNDVVAVVRSFDNPKEKGFEAAIVHLSSLSS